MAFAGNNPRRTGAGGPSHKLEHGGDEDRHDAHRRNVADHHAEQLFPVELRGKADLVDEHVRLHHPADEQAGEEGHDGHEHAVADNGKYNLGQKMLFWTLNLAMVTLLVTGIIMWRQYFSHYFSIPVLRFAIFLHSLSAFMLFTGILVHMYMAFWIKGSIRGIVEGWVTVRWAKKHHPKWYRDEVLPKLEEDLENEAEGKKVKTKALFKGING